MNKILRVLREIIKKEKTTIYSVAKAIGVDFSSLYKALKNGGNPGAKTIDKILNHLGYEVNFIKSKSKKRGGEKR
ncbi:MAG: helix-turn-helix domain-containing protein [Deltaproteobacteria bacterium]|nr:helix-turn-helix domain-containing protein [Deltaproteobacteria bacterium]